MSETWKNQKFVYKSLLTAQNSTHNSDGKSFHNSIPISHQQRSRLLLNFAIFYLLFLINWLLFNAWNCFSCSCSVFTTRNLIIIHFDTLAFIVYRWDWHPWRFWDESTTNNDEYEYFACWYLGDFIHSFLMNSSSNPPIYHSIINSLEMHFIKRKWSFSIKIK